jgi:hypothetical protein
MRKAMLLAALLATAACGQANKAEAPPAAPQGLMEQAAAMDPAQASVLAWQQLSAKTDLDPPCVAVRNVADKGMVPADVDPASIYAPYVGARVFSVQCGVQLTTVRARPSDRWLVVMKPGAPAAEIVNCADPQEPARGDRCYGDIPHCAPATDAPDAAAAGAADAAKTP